MTVETDLGSGLGANIELKNPGDSCFGAVDLGLLGIRLLGLSAFFVLFQPLEVFRDTVEKTLSCFFLIRGGSALLNGFHEGAFHLGMLQLIGFIASPAFASVLFPPGEAAWAGDDNRTELARTVVIATVASANRIERISIKRS